MTQTMPISEAGPGAAPAATTAASQDQWSPRVSAAMLARLAARAAVAAPAELTAVEAPFSGARLAEVPRGRPADVEAACAAAREAQQEWARRSASERAAVLMRYHDLVIANAQEILDLIQLESGKARIHAFEEVLDVAIQARYYAHSAAGFLREQHRQGALPVLTTTRVYHRPRGVIGVVAPWNYPFTLAIGDVLPAVVAGNGVVLKPDAQTPLTALWAAGLLEEAGLPPGLLQVVTGRGAELGATLVDQVDYMMFTGSTATGRTVAALCGERLKDCSMELGGKNALLVLPDAPLWRTVPGALQGITSNGGQLCVSIERVYVHDAVYDAFVPRLAEAMRAVRLGSSLTFADDVGSLASAEQLTKVATHVDDAVGNGAEVLAGGRARPDLGPYFYEPTLLAGVTEEMRLCRAETFGPVAAVYRCSSVDEMVARANDSDYGLNASVWTRDVKAGRRIAARLQTGTVNVNEAYAATWASAAPMGGWKQSGLERRHGRHGILKYTDPQTVAVQRLLNIGTPPFLSNGQYAAVMTQAVRLLKHVPGIK
jgi:succinate-semialdehyde dehydrogenase / glutarate-semialdehyde dehydrogenase